MKLARTNFTPRLSILRKTLAATFDLKDKKGGKLPKDFTIECYMELEDVWTDEKKLFRIKVIEGCLLPRSHKDFYLHRIFLQCGCCDKWCDAGHLKQHKC